MAKRSNKVTKLDTYLKMDIPSLLKKGDYQTLREMELYLNKMARQRLSRLEKANIKTNHRSKVIKGYTNLDFQTSYKGKYKLSNKDLKKYQNAMLKSIANAKHFLSMKSSKVSNYNKWWSTNKKAGFKFKDLDEAKKFWDLYTLLDEIAPAYWNSLSSTEKEHVCMAVQGYIPKSKLTWRESSVGRRVEEYLASKGEGTKEYRIWKEFFSKDINDKMDKYDWREFFGSK